MFARRALCGLGAGFVARGASQLQSEEDRSRQVFLWGDRRSLPALPEGTDARLPVRLPWFEESGKPWRAVRFGPTGGAALAGEQVGLWEDGSAVEMAALFAPGEKKQLRVADLHFARDRAVVLDSSGRVFTFRTGSGKQELEPVRVPCRWRERVVAVSAGAAHALLITSSGRLFGVGANDYGQLGSAPPLSEDEWGLPLPKEEDRNWSEAVLVDEGPVETASAGGRHTIFIKRKPTWAAWACGDDARIQLALGDTRHASTEMRGKADLNEESGSQQLLKENPIKYQYYEPHAQFAPIETLPPPALNRVPFPPPDFVACGEDFSVFVHRDSPEWLEESKHTTVLFCCGENWEAQCGRNRANQQQPLLPVRLPKRTRTVALACGSGHCLAANSLGDTYAWGFNAQGQVGNGGRASLEKPRRLRDGENVLLCDREQGYKMVAVAANYHASALIREKA